MGTDDFLLLAAFALIAWVADRWHPIAPDPPTRGFRVVAGLIIVACLVAMITVLVAVTVG